MRLEVKPPPESSHSCPPVSYWPRNLKNIRGAFETITAAWTAEFVPVSNVFHVCMSSEACNVQLAGAPALVIEKELGRAFVRTRCVCSEMPAEDDTRRKNIADFGVTVIVTRTEGSVPSATPFQF